jgi:hypothetical protein
MPTKAPIPMWIVERGGSRSDSSCGIVQQHLSLGIRYEDD